MSQNYRLDILQLYPKDMNIYGDNGNALVLKTRIEQYGFEGVLHAYNPGDELPAQVDIVLGGGGQDSGQDRIQSDLLQIKPRLRELAESGTPMLVICGLYQLFGHYFDTADGSRINGVSILDVTTTAGNNRLIGNVVAESPEFGKVIGYENHSGQTYLGAGVKPFAKVELGEGNNAEDQFEGARYKAVIGSYLHGALLPKNPAITDYLIDTALQNRYGVKLAEVAPKLDDSLIELARNQASQRPR